MLPDWIAVVAPSASLSALRIVIFVAANGAPAFGPHGRRVIAARVSQRNLQQANNLAPASVAAGIRSAVREGWLIRSSGVAIGVAATYAVPLFLNDAEPAVSTATSETVSENETPQPAFTNGVSKNDNAVLKSDTPSAKAAPGPRSDEAGTGFYGSILTGAAQDELARARKVEGLDEEIAMLRVKFRQIVAENPERLDLWLEASSVIARLLRTRHTVSRDQKRSLKEAVMKTFVEIGLPLGGSAARALFDK